MAHAATARDPICGRAVPDSGAERASYKSKTYHFCSRECRERFEGRAEVFRLADLARLGALFEPPRARFGKA